jgi:cytochrome c553
MAPKRPDKTLESMMLKDNLNIFLFFFFVMGMSWWAMQGNSGDQSSVHSCTGECYDNWKQASGGIVAVAVAQEEARAAASPVELGKAAYAGCIACHGSRGEGGVGPALVGQQANAIYDKLVQYKNGETRGSQSALMWSQSAMLGDEDMKNIAAFVESLSAQ